MLHECLGHLGLGLRVLLVLVVGGLRLSLLEVGCLSGAEDLFGCPGFGGVAGGVQRADAINTK